MFSSSSLQDSYGQHNSRKGNNLKGSNKNPFSHFILHLSPSWEIWEHIWALNYCVVWESSSADSSHIKSSERSVLAFPTSGNSAWFPMCLLQPFHTQQLSSNRQEALVSTKYIQGTKAALPMWDSPLNRTQSSHLKACSPQKFLHSTTSQDDLHSILLRHFFSHCITWGFKALWSPLSNSSSTQNNLKVF